MRNTRWLRYGLATLLVTGVGLGGLLVACGDDDTGSSSGNVPDGSTPDSNQGETSTPEGGETGTPDAGSNAKLTLINALTDLGPSASLGANSAFRVCFKTGTTATNKIVAPYPPLPDRAPAGSTAPPGIYYSTGGTFPAFPVDLSTRIIQPIIMNAKNLFAKGIINPGDGTPGTTCGDLVGDTADANSGLVANVDYWELPQIDAGAFQRDKAYVLLLTGCVGDTTDPVKPKCGAEDADKLDGNPGVGNMKVRIFETTRAPISATALGAQFVHGSAQAAAVFAAAGAGITVSPGFVDTDGGFKGVPADGGVALYAPLGAVTSVSGVTDTDGFALGAVSPGGGGPLLPYTLPQIQAFSGLGAPTAPTVYKDGKNYVFVAVGDPDTTQTPPFVFADGGGADAGAAGSSFNTKFFHFLAFPTDPTVAIYAP